MRSGDGSIVGRWGGGGGMGGGGIWDSQTSFQKLLKGAFFAPKI